MVKAYLYIIILPFSIWAMEGLDLNRFFKQSRIYQARAIYLLLAMCVTYLTVNMLYDFLINFQIVK